MAEEGIAQLVCIRWRRYGKDRLYVETKDGTKLGWWDLLSEQAHPESEVDSELLASAFAEWRVRDDSQVSGPDGQPRAAADSVESTPLDASSRPWIDLADNAPGASARENALAATASAPVRSLFARALGVHTNERAWRLGAEGEVKVGDQLMKVAKKDPRWRFLHAVPVGVRGSDIDHLAIGPGGVFTLNAKHHPGAKIWIAGDTFMVDGHRQPYIRNSRHEAPRAARLLTAACGFDVHVEGVVVTVNASDFTVKKPPIGVSAVYRRGLARWLLQHGDVLATDVIEAVFTAARRSTTWTG